MAIERLKECVQAFTRLVERSGKETDLMVAEGRTILSDLIRHDDWLPEFAAAANETSYRQYLLHCDPLERFSIVSFVWGPGQRTPVHNHTVWGLVGVLRGEEHSRRYELTGNGPLRALEADKMVPGDIDVVSPTHGDIHEVSNGIPDRPSISIHVYGANIGAVSRSIFDPKTGEERSMISGYHNATVPNLWFRQ